MSKKKNTPEIPLLPNREAVDGAIAEVGRLRREIQRIELDMNDKVAKIQEEAGQQSAPLAEALKQHVLSVEAYCHAHRDELTAFRQEKTVQFPSGVVAWRIRPPAVNVRDGKAVMEALRELKLHRFIRIKAEINKDAILNDPAAVRNVKGLNVVKDQEDFIVTPSETKLEEIR